MYPKKRVDKAVLVEIDDLNLYEEEIIESKVEEGVLSPEEGGFLRGNNLGGEYLEEEEEE